jgi:cell wall-associated NlpC family hydrolase
MRTVLRLLPVAAAVALIVPAMTPQVASASPVDQQRQHVENIVDELERLQEQANVIAEDYNEAIGTKAQLDQEIVEAEQRVAEKEAELTKLRGDLSDMAVRSFVGGGGNPLGPLFEDATDVNEVLQRDQLARVALSAGDATTDELDALVADLQSERDELDRKRAEADALADQLLDQQAETERLTDEYTEARADAEAKLGQLIAEEEQRRAEESARQLQAQVEAALAANSSNSSSGGSGGGGGSNDSSTGGGGGGGGGGTPAPTPTPSTGGGGGSNPGGGSTPPSGVPPAVSSRSSIAVNAALSQQGVPYRFAASSPGVAFDCSGLTKYAWGQAGVYLPHQSRAQYASLPHVSPSAAQPGDLIFFYSPISHVSVYLGGGQQVHAPNTGSVVSIATVNWSKVTGVGRPG